jgi:GH18 family chitinase
MSFAQIVETYAGAEKHDVSGNHIYYNGLETMRRKVAYVLNGDYGGIMIWQLAQDAPGTKSLLLAIDQVIHKKR